MTIIGYPQEQMKLSVLRTNAFLCGINCFLGSLFIALMTQISVYLPYTPVPVTMQVLALFLLVLVQGKGRATGSVVLYLVQATLGMPVLAMGTNPLWMVGPTAGYMIGFMGCTFVSGYLLEKQVNPSFLRIFFSLTAGLLVTYFAGAFFLSLLFGVHKALTLGILPFIGIDLLKAGFAASLCVPASGLKEQLLKRGF